MHQPCPVTRRNAVLTLALLAAFSSGNSFASCGSSSCSINADWAEHGISRPGWSADLRYSYSRADTLRSGSDKISANPTDPANAGIEVENQRTINQVITATLDYSHDEHWGMLLQLPYVMRDHTHSIGDPNPALVSSESFNASAVGDVKAVGRYRWTLDEAKHSGAGLKLGLKLNTGRTDFQLLDASGVAKGVPQEVTLQPGNDSTDVIIGVFWNQSAPGSDWSWFAQASLQSSIASSRQFRPGNQSNLDGGTRYAFNNRLNGLLQINAQWNEIDSGSSAALSPVSGGPSSGASSLALTPGLSYAFTRDTQLYGLLQLPLYQYVHGEQLTADYAVSVGVSHHF
jgi:hypothetical protein